MSAETNSKATGGMGLGTVLFIVFLILKLCNVIDWSWWWVTAPLWIPAGLALIVIIICGIIMACTDRPSKYWWL